MKILIFLQDFAGGGAERVALALANGMVENHDISIALARREGPYLADVKSGIEIIDFGGVSTLKSIMPLRRLLRDSRPDILISHLTHVNVACGIANALAGHTARHIAVEHNQLGTNYARLTSKSVKLAYRMARYVYPRIDAIVQASDGVAESVRAFTGLRGENFHTIANPVVSPGFDDLAAQPPAHRWFRDGGSPVLLGCGRLVEQKAFDVLIEAMALVNARRPARLVILGEGELRPQLEALVAARSLEKVVDLAGFDRNPYAAMAACDLFVLSSGWEGLPTVVIEALAAGADVVSTDCPSGPKEILQSPHFGSLVQVGDAPALADAICAALDNPRDKAAQKARGNHYSLAAAVTNYENLCLSLLGKA